MKRPSPSQTIALRLASQDAIRYYKGGWYSIPAVFGENQANHPRQTGFSLLRSVAPSVNAGTLRSCVARGWLEVVAAPPPYRSIYDARWTITDEGRYALIKAEGGR